MSNTLDKVKSVFCDVLEKSEGDISGDKTIFVDLEVESVEALELEFSLEEEFDITIEKDSLWKLPSYIAENNLMSDNGLNDEAKALVQKSYLSLSDLQLNQITTPNDLHNFLTVQDVASYVEKMS